MKPRLVESADAKTAIDERLPYRAPLLLRYGAVSELTQGGAGSIRETVRSSTQCWANSKKYPCR